MSTEPDRTGEGRRRRRAESEARSTDAGGAAGEVEEVIEAGTTGEWLILFREDDAAMRAGTRALGQVAGLQVASAADFDGSVVTPETLGSEAALVFPELNVAVTNASPDQLRLLGAQDAEQSGILAIEPNRVVYALDEGWADAAAPGVGMVARLQAFQAGVNAAVAQAVAASGLSVGGEVGVRETFADTADFIWGLQATNVPASQFTGKGVRVAVLDTGFDLGHPDFVGRNVVAQSFIQGETAQDGHGHGTHCIGTACGPKRAGQGPRYGIAHGADIFAGKVLSNRGSGSDAGILAGINWALANGCAIISMSLGAATTLGQAFSQVYESVAQRALARGTLIIAAAGNESRRPGTIKPVAHPANCPSILAVAAVDQQLQVAFFSSAGLNPRGGQVDIAGPGVDTRSSWPRPTLYRSISGTSMATPHVAGIAALHVEAQGGAMRGGALGWLLLQSSRRLVLPASDIGVGLVQAP